MLAWTALLVVYSAAFMSAESGLAPFVFFCLWILAVANSVFGLRRLPLWLAALVPFSAGFMLLQSAPAAIGLLAFWLFAIATCLLGRRKVMLWGTLVGAYSAAFAAVKSNLVAIVSFAVLTVLVAIARVRVGPRRLALLCAMAGAALWPAFYFAGVHYAVHLPDVLLSAFLGAILGFGLAAVVETGGRFVNWADSLVPRTPHAERHNRARLQFSLMQMLIAVALLSVAPAWIAANLERGRRNRDAAAWLNRHGVTTMHRSANWLEGLLSVRTPISSVNCRSDPRLDDSAFADALAHVPDLGSLRSVGLSRCSVSDVAVRQSNGLRGLEFLALDYTNVTDDGLRHVEGLTRLKGLSLAETRVTDEGVRHVRTLEEMRHLDLSGTKITDATLEDLEGLHNLESLGLSRTHVTDAGLEYLRGLSNLKSVNLERTEIGDAGVAHLGGLTNLSELNLARTRVTDAGVEHLERLHNLRQIDLVGTRVSAAGLARLRAALPRAAAFIPPPTSTGVAAPAPPHSVQPAR